MDARPPLPLFPPSDQPRESGADDQEASAAPTATVGSSEERLALALRLLPLQRMSQAAPLLLPGQAPAGLPLNLPVPPGGRIVGSMLDAPPPQTTTATILIDTPLSDERLRQFYTEQLEALGWRMQPFPSHRGGFVHVWPSGFMHTRFAADANDYALTLTAHSGATPDETTLAIEVRRDDPAQMAQWRGAGPERMRGVEALAPALLPPPGGSQQGGGGGGGSGRWHSSAQMETDLPVAQVIAHYDAQLARGGWTRRDGGASGPVGWSFWSLADAAGEPWRGAMLALNSPDRPRDYLLLLQIESESGADPRQGGYSTHGILSSR